MTITTIDDSQRKTAKLAGFAYLFTFVTVVYTNFGIYNKLNVPNNATETARNILANELLFRAAIIADMFYAAGFVLLLVSLYTMLKNINRMVVLIATVWQLIYVITWVALTLKLFDSLRLLGGINYLQVFNEEQLYSLSKLFLSARFDRYYGVLMFYSLGATLFNYLWFKSRFIPRPLALWGIVASAWCVVCAITFIIYPDFNNLVNDWYFDFPMALFDITLGFWLLIKGIKVPAHKQTTSSIPN